MHAEICAQKSSSKMCVLFFFLKEYTKQIMVKQFNAIM